MKNRRNREINVFSLSAVDLFCSALGAFIIITIIAMPSYMKKSEQESKKDVHKEHIEQIKEENIKLRKNLQIAKKELEKTNEKILELKEKQTANYLIIIASWDTQDDIDTYMIDPQKRMYAYHTKYYNGIKASLAEDARISGTEVWETSELLNGTYELYFVAFEKRIELPTKIKLRAYTKDGKKDLSDLIVDARCYSKTYFITVDSNKNISFNLKDKERILKPANPK